MKLPTHRIVNKSMRCATKDTEGSKARLCSAAADESKSSQAVGDRSSAASSIQPAAVAAVGSRGEATRETMSLSSYTPASRVATPT